MGTDKQNSRFMHDRIILREHYSHMRIFSIVSIDII